MTWLCQTTVKFKEQPRWVLKKTLQTMNHAGPSVWAAIHVLHSGHFFSCEMGAPHDGLMYHVFSLV